MRFEAILPRVACTLLGTWVGVATQSVASPGARALGEGLASLLVTAGMCSLIFMVTEPLRPRRPVAAAARRRPAVRV